MMETTTKKRKKLREPIDEYDCFYMDCRECVYYGGKNRLCNHPEKYVSQ